MNEIQRSIINDRTSTIFIDLIRGSRAQPLNLCQTIGMVDEIVRPGTKANGAKFQDAGLKKLVSSSSMYKGRWAESWLVIE